MSKKKRKLKRLLKGVALAGAIGLGAKALANRRAKPLGVSGADKALFTSDAAYLDNTMPANLSKDMGMKRTRRGSILADPKINKMDTSEVDIPENYFKVPVKKTRPNITFGTGNDGLSYFKSGGKVVKTGEKVAKRKKKIGIQIKGFGKARRG